MNKEFVQQAMHNLLQGDITAADTSSLIESLLLFFQDRFCESTVDTDTYVTVKHLQGLLQTAWDNMESVALENDGAGPDPDDLDFYKPY